MLKVNHSFNSAIVGLSVIGFSLLGSSAQAANLINNGGFAQNNLTTDSAYIGSGQGTISGWTVNKGYSFLIKDGMAATTDINQSKFGPDPRFGGAITAPSKKPVSFYGSAPVNSADGSGWFVAMDGAYGPTDPTISQTVTGLTAGKDYILSFYQASAQQKEFDGASTDYWEVTFGGKTLLSSTMNHASKAPVSGWQQQTLTFTANASSSVLKFLAQGSPDGNPPFALLSGISLEEVPGVPTATAIPTPALLPGLVGLGLGVWRKRKSQSVEQSANS
jgi:hypothetical protein